VEITHLHYKILDGAADGDLLGHLLYEVTDHIPGAGPVVTHGATTAEETSAALIELLREGMVELEREPSYEELGGRGRQHHTPEILSTDAAVALVRDPASWTPPRSARYSVGTTEAGDAALDAAARRFASSG
jgi:hypothetical protein